MKLRKGKLSDWKELLNILNKTPELNGMDGGKYYTAKWVKNSLTDKKNNLILIVENNKKIGGILIAELFKEKGYSFFVALYVHPEYRRMGLSSKLMSEYDSYCKKLKLKSIVALVLKDNEKMQKIIEKKQYKRGKLLYYYEKSVK